MERLSGPESSVQRLPEPRGGAPLTLRVAAWTELVALRREVLRAGLPVSAAMIPEDDAQGTLHVGAFIEGNGAPSAVGCGTLVLSRFSNQHPGLSSGQARRQAELFDLQPFEARDALRLRQMAVDADYRGAGVGGNLLRFAEQWVRVNTLIRLLWCDARLPAVPFYQRQGWRIVSERFFWPTAGPHHRMLKELR